MRHFKHVFGFRSFQGRIFCLFLGEFPDNLLFLKLFAKCLRQKCKYVVPEQCMST